MTVNTQERIGMAQWVLERNLGWIAAAEIKVAAICAIDTAMLAGLGAVFTMSGPKNIATYILGGLALLLVVAGFFCAAMVLKPRLTGGPTRSMLYFGKIAEVSWESFDREFLRAQGEDFLKDLTGQIHLNARIAQRKHEWVIRCLNWSLIGALVWLLAIIVALS